MSSTVARRQARGEPHCGCHSNSVDGKSCRDHKRLTLTILLDGALVGAVVAITPTTVHNARSATLETSISTPEKDFSPLDSQMCPSFWAHVCNWLLLISMGKQRGHKLQLKNHCEHLSTRSDTTRIDFRIRCLLYPGKVRNSSRRFCGLT